VVRAGLGCRSTFIGSSSRALIACGKHHQPVASVDVWPTHQPVSMAIKPDLLSQLARAVLCHCMSTVTMLNSTLSDSALAKIVFCMDWFYFSAAHTYIFQTLL
jgi:hypothetical protein